MINLSILKAQKIIQDSCFTMRKKKSCKTSKGIMNKIIYRVERVVSNILRSPVKKASYTQLFQLSLQRLNQELIFIVVRINNVAK